MRSAQSLVSVVVATYNMAQYLGQAIESVLSQSYKHLELHLVDDGSTDGTAALVKEFSSDSRFHYHWQENTGQTSAKNTGIAKCSGDFISFCDADDRWTPDKLELQMALFARDSSVGVVYGRKQQISSTGALLELGDIGEPAFRGEVTADLFKLNFIPFGTAIARRECFERLGVFNERYRMGIDWDLWLRFSAHYRFDYVDSVVYLYRVWSGQMSHNWRGRYDHAFAIMEDFLKKHPGLIPESTVREAYAHSYYSRARMRALNSGEYVEGVRDVVRALKHRPLYFHAWKLLARIAYVAASRSRTSGV